MSDIDLETRLREQLPRLADFAVPTDAPAAPLPRVQVPGAPRPARRRVLAAVGIAAALVVGAVVVVAPWSGDGRSAPIGVSTDPQPIVGTLTVTAYNFHFDQPEYHVPPGRTEIHFVSAEGSHTLRFVDRSVGADDLMAASNAPPHGPQSLEKFATATVDLEAGRTYVIYCELPGHRTAGMESRIVVDGTATSTTTAP